MNPAQQKLYDFIMSSAKLYVPFKDVSNHRWVDGQMGNDMGAHAEGMGNYVFDLADKAAYELYRDDRTNNMDVAQLSRNEIREVGVAVLKDFFEMKRQRMESKNNIDRIITESINRVIGEADRHKPGYWAKRWAKQKANGTVPKGDRHKPGYYSKYNKEHPERLERGFTKGYVNGNYSEGKPKQINYPDGCIKDLGDGYYIDKLGWKRHIDSLTDALLRKEQEWHDNGWYEGMNDD